VLLTLRTDDGLVKFRLHLQPLCISGVGYFTLAWPFGLEHAASIPLKYRLMLFMTAAQVLLTALHDAEKHKWKTLWR